MEEGSLYFAVAENNPEKLRQLLEEGGNVDEFYEDTMNISSKSLLHVCCGKGHVECLKVLIDHGAQLDVRDKWGQTPLMYSVSIQFEEVVKVLLEAKPELVECQDRFGKSSLHCAVESGNVYITKLLLQYGANVNVRCDDGMSPLMNSCIPDSEGQRLEVMQVLLDAGAMIDLSDYRGRRTALHVAVTNGNVKAVEILLSAGAEIDAIDKTLRTPLTHAVFGGVRGSEVKDTYMSIISLLVSAGADLNMSTTEGCNPLLSAALLKSEFMVNYFLSLGADPNVKFPSGVTPALVCASTGDLSTLRPLIHYNCDLHIKGSVYKRRLRLEFFIDPFELAYLEGYLTLCTFMVEAGYSVFSKNVMFETDLSKTSGDWTPPPLTARTTNLSQENLTLTNAQHLPPDFRDLLAWLLNMSRTPRSLKEAAMFVVRKHLGRKTAGSLSELPVPSKIKDFIQLKHLLL